MLYVVRSCSDMDALYLITLCSLFAVVNGRIFLDTVVNYQVNVGDVVTLNCSINGSAFDVGLFSVYWNKYNINSVNVTQPLATATAVVSPFLDTQRYRMLYSHNQVNNNYYYSLQINGTVLGDGGVFQCVAGTDSQDITLALVTAPTSLSIVGVTIDPVTGNMATSNPNPYYLEYQNMRPAPLSCTTTVLGSASVNILAYINGKDITYRFGSSYLSNSVLTGNVTGLQYNVNQYTLRANNFMMPMAWSSNTFSCKVQVNGAYSYAVNASTILLILAKPMTYSCGGVTNVTLGQPNVLTCTFRCRPNFYRIIWTVYNTTSMKYAVLDIGNEQVIPGVGMSSIVTSGVHRDVYSAHLTINTVTTNILTGVGLKIYNTLGSSQNVGFSLVDPNYTPPTTQTMNSGVRFQFSLLCCILVALTSTIL